MKRTAVVFTGPGNIEVREEAVEEPGEGQVLVETISSAISAGTELLLYRGEFPADMPIDATIPGYSRPLRYPLKYGYAAVGRVVRTGSGVPDEWVGRRVFSLHPHESCFVCGIDELLPLPEHLSAGDAVALPLVETAVSLVMDGRPVIGEDAAVFGQGVVGLLTTALLARFPLRQLITFDRHELRRRKSRELGAHTALDPAQPDADETALGRCTRNGSDGADLSFELSGDPRALASALKVTGFAGRIVIGSWYGTKDVTLHLGGAFHRRRQHIISSQVSTLSPGQSGRWTKSRRTAAALALTETLKPSALITHRAKIDQAAQLYDLLERSPGETLLAVFDYGAG